ncbi:uncharacterized protein SCHCODRAFT_02672236 [Schizophyllum commune H4-8]|nr:uncharacterized protein SCHCODRAFT_02672236 [Schizophyllum commune H4-8]KAI5887068.1 hypothetical protein SCHCODRAFT_02672236 [Schizophyllum commune H4-8]
MDATPVSASSTSSSASSYSQFPMTTAARPPPPQDVANSTWPMNEASPSFDATNSREDAAHGTDAVQYASSDVAIDSAQNPDLSSPRLRPVAYRNEAYLDDGGNLCSRCCRVATHPPGQPCALNPKSLRRHETFIVAEPEP